jgi:hypothetical protein
MGPQPGGVRFAAAGGAMYRQPPRFARQVRCCEAVAHFGRPELNACGGQADIQAEPPAQQQPGPQQLRRANDGILCVLLLDPASFFIVNKKRLGFAH